MSFLSLEPSSSPVVKRLRQMIKWFDRSSAKRYFGVSITLTIALSLIALAATIVGIAIPLDDVDYLFDIAYLCLAIAFLWSLGCWAVYRPRSVPFLLFIFVVFGGSFGLEAKLQFDNAYVFYLSPDNKPAPPTSCDTLRPVINRIAPNGLTIILGNFGSAVASQFPAVVIGIEEQPILTMDKDSDNHITVSGDFYDGNHDIVAEIDHNHFKVERGVFRKIRHASTLTVVARHDKETVLRVKYLNPATVYIVGTFRDKNGSVLVVDDNQTVFNGGIMHGADDCVVDARAGAFDFKEVRHFSLTPQPSPGP